MPNKISQTSLMILVIWPRCPLTTVCVVWLDRPRIRLLFFYFFRLCSFL